MSRIKCSRLFFVLTLIVAAGCSYLKPPRITPTPLLTASAPTPTALPSPASTANQPTIACSELGSTWTGGTATMRADGSGYDISACVRPIPMRQAEMVKPAERDSAKWGNARCNDGTPFGFSVQLSPSGQHHDWIIHLKGGGFCDDNAISCSGRGKDLSSTPDARDGAMVEMVKTGIFNRNAAQNPAFHDFNMSLHTTVRAMAGAAPLLRSAPPWPTLMAGISPGA